MICECVVYDVVRFCRIWYEFGWVCMMVNDCVLFSQILHYLKMIAYGVVWCCTMFTFVFVMMCTWCLYDVYCFLWLCMHLLAFVWFCVFVCMICVWFVCCVWFVYLIVCDCSKRLALIVNNFVWLCIICVWLVYEVLWCVTTFYDFLILYDL